MRVFRDLSGCTDTVQGNIIRDLRKGAAEVNVEQHIHCGIEVVRVDDAPGAEDVVVSYRRTGTDETPREIRCSNVIFCTGSLQRPNEVTLPGEGAFGGPVVEGLNSNVNELDMAGKRVCLLGMGAFAIENARLALLSGAAHVDMIVRNRVPVTSRFTRILNILSAGGFFHERGDPAYSPRFGLPETIDRNALHHQQYAKTGALDARPDRTDRGGTPGTTSDIFFLGHALGRLAIHRGIAESLEPGQVVARARDGSLQRFAADIVIKNLGFEGVESGDRMGGVCEVVGKRCCRPPIWITERVVTFRHQTDMPRLSQEDSDRLGEEALAQELAELDGAALRARAEAEGLGAEELSLPKAALLERLLAALRLLPNPNPPQGEWLGPHFVGSSPHGNSVWLELFLHFRARPGALRALLRFDGVPRTALSGTSNADIQRGMRAVLYSDDGLRARVNANRRRIGDETFRRYAPPGTPEGQLLDAWALGFLEQNRADWQDSCEALTGRRDAVEYLWEGELLALREDAQARVGVGAARG